MSIWMLCNLDSNQFWKLNTNAILCSLFGWKRFLKARTSFGGLLQSCSSSGKKTRWIFNQIPEKLKCICKIWKEREAYHLCIPIWMQREFTIFCINLWHFESMYIKQPTFLSLCGNLKQESYQHFWRLVFESQIRFINLWKMPIQSTRMFKLYSKISPSNWKYYLQKVQSTVRRKLKNCRQPHVFFLLCRYNCTHSGTLIVRNHPKTFSRKKGCEYGKMNCTYFSHTKDNRLILKVIEQAKNGPKRALRIWKSYRRYQKS